ncbi:endolytic transglycosylase MltG [Halonatronum saccharophilum]|uniref:endolytic transglycosylase MltG n=1 Tax=Halonatronum saccharophilum TaxID=150060 RepID=UPI001FDFF475|nr:endolytic transglycosylase MltG [Halonatronum saccharophilum]
MKTIIKFKQVVIVLALLFFILNFFLFSYGQKLLGPRLEDNGVENRIVEIKSGYSLNRIVDKLYEEELINSPLAFKLYLKLKGKSTNLQAGYYQLNPTMSTIEIIDRLIKGENAYYRVTIPEGATVEEVSSIFHMRGLDRERFLEVAKNIDMNFLENREDLYYNAEGFLFPDTYKIPYGSSEEDIIRIMLREFQKKIRDLEEGIEESEFSLHQIITIASMIEGEARVKEEGPKIASVIYNRLDRGMRLQLDATVQYALPQRESRLLYRHLEAESLYNTYRRDGLPPGPINNPGIDSIKSTLNPVETDYLFYVARGDGGHIFTRTYQEHLEVQRGLR